MTALEDLLRESLRDRGTLPRLTDDVAGTAIRGARTVRRRRVTLVAAAAVVAVLVGLGGLALGRPTAAPAVPATGTAVPEPTPTGATPRTRYGIDADLLVADDQLFTRDGQTHQLATATVNFIVRVPAGWLYGGVGPSTLLRTDGSTVPITDIDTNKIYSQFFAGPAVSSDGQHLAWVSAGTLHAATLTRDGLIGIVTSPVPADSFAETWIGSQVVVGQSYGTGCCGFRPAQYDVWDPAAGNFVPHWTKGLWPVYGPVPAGVAAYGMVAKDPGNINSPAGCLARVDGVNSMAVTSVHCLPGLAFESTTGAISPDGLHVTEQADGEQVVIDLTTATEIGVCFATPFGFWESNTSLISLDTTQRTVPRCTLSGRTVSRTADGTTYEPGSAARPIDHYGV